MDNGYKPAVVTFLITVQNALRGDINLFSCEQSPEEYSRLSGLVTLMTSQPYQDLAERLCQLFKRELNRIEELGT